ncbi:hydroxylamine reductase, partial [Clostridium perfringens]|nr:hydroxylamine reductase [Clostridium perfringens]
MFCYQCEQTMGGKGCTKMGVCGKTPEVANLQDLLIYQLKGIACYAKPLIEKGELIDKEIVKFVENGLFTTLTNVNFDVAFHVKLLKDSQKIKESLRSRAPKGDYPEQAKYNLSSSKEEMLKDSVKAGIMYDQSLDPDI